MRPYSILNILMKSITNQPQYPKNQGNEEYNDSGIENSSDQTIPLIDKHEQQILHIDDTGYVMTNLTYLHLPMCDVFVEGGGGLK